MKVSSSISIFVLTVFGLIGCETTQRLDSQQISIESLQSDVAGLRTQNQVTNDRVYDLEVADQETASAMERVVNRLENTEKGVAVNKSGLEVIRGRLASMEYNNIEQDRRLNRIEAGARNLRQAYGQAVTTAEVVNPEFRGVVPISFGPFAPGSATPTNEIKKLIEATKKSLGVAVVNGATQETVVERVVGFYDDAPIKKSAWPSNDELGQARAQAVADGIGFATSVVVEVRTDPKRFGSRVDNRCVVVITRTTILDE